MKVVLFLVGLNTALKIAFEAAVADDIITLFESAHPIRSRGWNFRKLDWLGLSAGLEIKV